MKCPNCDSENYHEVDVIGSEDDTLVFLNRAGFCADCYCIQYYYPAD